jgi:IS605 OrfB family transposase
MHKASRKLVDYLHSNDHRTLITGYNGGWKKGINLGKRNNQNFAYVPFLRFVRMVEYKCRLKGITVFRQEESYTSKCSFLDCEEIGKHEAYAGKRVKRGLFRSSDGTHINADLNGALNILIKGMKALGKPLDWLSDKVVRKSFWIEVCSTPSVQPIG